MKNFKPLAFLLCCMLSATAFAQTTNGRYVKDKKTGLKIWLEQDGISDSISWKGGGRNKMAEGFGTLTWYAHGNETAHYTGDVVQGKATGKGTYTHAFGLVLEGNFVNGKLNGPGKMDFGDGRKLEGNFVNGEFLNLDAPYLQLLQRNVISKTDTSNNYVNDGIATEMFYHALVPPKIKGVLVLFPCTWEATTHTLSSNKQLCQLAFDNGLAVLVPSINQRLALNDELLGIINTMFTDAINRYQLPKDKFVLGGFSMGGVMSLRYTEMAYEDPLKTAVVPKAVYSVDGPADLENIYRAFQKQLLNDRNPNHGEPEYGIREIEQYTGGAPEKFHERFVYYSPYVHSEKDGGNAKFLKNVPVRIYNDVDVNWWLDNRGEDMYDMNALDQSAMINLLRANGNTRAEFINAFGKGYRIEGNRHPHSWSLVDPVECLGWINSCLAQ